MSDLELNTVHVGDCISILRGMAADSIDCCVTSPPYWGLRDYGNDEQIGLESTPDAYIAKMVAVFAEVRRVLKPEGTCWLNLGDSYAGSGKGQGGQGTTSTKQLSNHGSYHGGLSTTFADGLKPKDLCMIPARVALALQADGWWLRSDIIWAKPNPMPESCKDRPTSAHEHIYLLTKSAKYWYDADAIAEPATYAGDDRGARSDSRRGTECNSMNGSTGDTRNARNVWTIATKPYSGAHFAVFPPEIPRRCILAGCPEGGIVLDPFFGSGTTGEVAETLGRQWVGIELNAEYAELAKKRTQQRGLFQEAK